MTANYEYSGGPWTTAPNSGHRSIGDVLESERKLAEQVRQLQAQVQAVREQVVQDTPYPGGYADGWYAAMQTILDALDGPDE